MPVSLEQFSKVVALIHEAGAAPERWTDALAAIVGLVEGARGALMDIDAGTNALIGIGHVGHDPANARTYAEHYYALDPTRAAVVAAPAFRAMTTYDHFPKRVRDTHEYFDWAHLIDIGDVIGVGTSPSRGCRSLVSVQRGAKASAYGEQEKRLFGLLASHVALAKRVQMELGDAWSASAQLEAAFGRLAMAAFIVDGEARVRHLNSAATALMARHAEVVFRGGRLLLADAKLNATLQAALRHAAGPGACAAALPLSLSGLSAEILVSPLGAAHGTVSAWQIPLALVMIAAPTQDEKSIAWRMEQVYRLTPTESRIAAMLALGRTVEQIARDRRVSEATLRTHLRSIFSKTGTRRQAELMQLALRGTVLKHRP